MMKHNEAINKILDADNARYRASLNSMQLAQERAECVKSAEASDKQLAGWGIHLQKNQQKVYVNDSGSKSFPLL